MLLVENLMEAAVNFNHIAQNHKFASKATFSVVCYTSEVANRPHLILFSVISLDKAEISPLCGWLVLERAMGSFMPLVAVRGRTPTAVTSRCVLPSDLRGL